MPSLYPLHVDPDSRDRATETRYVSEDRLWGSRFIRAGFGGSAGKTKSIRRGVRGRVIAYSIVNSPPYETDQVSSGYIRGGASAGGLLTESTRKREVLPAF